jgi:hypothetical protein
LIKRVRLTTVDTARKYGRRIANRRNRASVMHESRKCVVSHKESP